MSSIPRAHLGAFGSLVLAAATAACGDKEVSYVLSLHSSYDVIGVVRILPDGITPAEMRDIYLTFDQIVVAGSQMSGRITPKGRSDSHDFSGEFDSGGNMHLQLGGPAVLTSTLSETVDELGGRADDVLPEDGLADELTGFVRTRAGAAIHDGVLIGVARQTGRPDPVEETKVTLAVSALGMVTMAGEAGSVPELAGVELFRFQLFEPGVENTLGQADGNGAFEIEVPGTREDVFVARVRRGGRAGDARFFRVQP